MTTEPTTADSAPGTTLFDVRSTPRLDTGSPVILLLHGYGSHERDLAGLGPALDLGLPWASLRAPVEMGGGGAAWFPIERPSDPDATIADAATDAIWAWLDTHAGPTSVVVPIGFSQGGLMASRLLRTRPERVLATVVLGGFVQSSPQPADDTLARTRPPVFWGRGLEDRVITPEAIARTASWLPDHSDLTERTYAGLAHGISQEEFDDVREFLRERLTAA